MSKTAPILGSKVAAIGVACPRCGAKPMERCRLLNPKTKRRYTAHPHYSRRRAVL